jgi:hypothetical protein
MSSPFESLRRDTQALPDGPDKKAMLEMLAQGEELEERYRATIRVQKESDRLQLRKERILRFFFLLPLSVATGYFPVRGLLEGKIMNIFIDIDAYAYWNSDPFVFAFLVMFFGVAALAFLCVAAGITYFGRRASSPMTRPEFDRLVKEFEKENAARQAEMVEIGSLFGRKTYGVRVSNMVAALVIIVLLASIIYGAINGSR